jgi:RNA polymerase sigma-70 factor (ECF subfamily)
LLDTSDIWQSVLLSFFVRAAAGQFQLDSPEQLVKLLATMARNKVTNQALKQQAARRDYRRQQDLAGAAEPVARDPSPSQVLANRELVEKCRGLLSEEERFLADERAAGRSWEEIAAAVGGTPAALYMRLKRGLDRVARQLGLEA